MAKTTLTASEYDRLRSEFAIAATHCRLSVSALVDHAVARYVKAEGFGRKPPER